MKTLRKLGIEPREEWHVNKAERTLFYSLDCFSINTKKYKDENVRIEIFDKDIVSHLTMPLYWHLYLSSNKIEKGFIDNQNDIQRLYKLIEEDFEKKYQYRLQKYSQLIELLSEVDKMFLKAGGLSLAKDSKVNLKMPVELLRKINNTVYKNDIMNCDI